MACHDKKFILMQCIDISKKDYKQVLDKDKRIELLKIIKQKCWHCNREKHI